MAERKNEEWASHYKDIVFSVHLVDLYICPSSSQISHAIEIGMCSMSYPVIDRNTADLMRIAIQDKLPSRLSDQCTLRKEKAGGLVSKAQPWLLTSKLRELRDNEDQERYDVLRQKLNDFHKEWSQLHPLIGCLPLMVYYFYFDVVLKQILQVAWPIPR